MPNQLDMSPKQYTTSYKVWGYQTDLQAGVSVKQSRADDFNDIFSLGTCICKTQSTRRVGLNQLDSKEDVAHPTIAPIRMVLL